MAQSMGAGNALFNYRALLHQLTGLQLKCPCNSSITKLLVSIQIHLFCLNFTPLIVRSILLGSFHPPVAGEMTSSAWRDTVCTSLHLPLRRDTYPSILLLGNEPTWPRPLGWFLMLICTFHRKLGYLLFQVIKRNKMHWHNTSSSITDYFLSEKSSYYFKKLH